MSEWNPCKFISVLVGRASYVRGEAVPSKEQNRYCQCHIRHQVVTRRSKDDLAKSFWSFRRRTTIVCAWKLTEEFPT